MSKVLGSWSGMRKYLEQDMLAGILKGRVSYSCTTYFGMDDMKIFEISVDKKPIKRFSWETVNTYFINNGYKEDNDRFGEMGYWMGFTQLLSDIPINSWIEYTDGEFCDALEKYRNQDISLSIASDNPLVRMFAILDRRIGKRTLSKIKDSIHNQPEWLQYFYNLRLESEKI